MHDKSFSPYPFATARSLREACQKIGLDRGGARCPDCPVRDLCEDDERWLVSRPAVSRLQ